MRDARQRLEAQKHVKVIAPENRIPIRGKSFEDRFGALIKSIIEDGVVLADRYELTVRDRYIPQCHVRHGAP